VDLILAEDTRSAKKLLSALNIPFPRIVSFFEHNEEDKLGQIESYLQEGKEIALLSEAGTPLLADPGFQLVRTLRQKGATIIPIPGPSAITAALMAAGIAPLPFTFLGFLPRKTGEIEAVFREFKQLKSTLVFFERKNRVAKTLNLALKVLGKREVCLAREISKIHEEFIYGILGEIDLDKITLKGEFTILIGPPLEDKVDKKNLNWKEVLEKYREKDLKPKQLAQKIAKETGLSPKEVYTFLIKNE
jgi:16S rRNA (cytidine1402-2'-O)-methyltransferase